MPIISIDITANILESRCDELKYEIQKSLRVRWQIEKKDITIRFPIVQYSERLVVRYETRSDKLLVHDKCTREAEIIGQIVEFTLKFSVESIVSVLGRQTTGIYLTPSGKFD